MSPKQMSIPPALASPYGAAAQQEAKLSAASQMQWGLVGVAAVGSVTLEMDENLEGGGYAITVSIPPFQFRLPARDRSNLLRLASFLNPGEGNVSGTINARPSEFSLSDRGSPAAVLVRDTEYSDRVFMRVESGGFDFELTLADSLLADFGTAVAQLVEELPPVDLSPIPLFPDRP